MKRRDFLKIIGSGALTVIIPGCADSLRDFAKKDTARKPNIIFILADDLGWAELGCYGNTFNETTNLDKLAAEGVRFTQAYSSAPVCSPYRAALMIGQYPARIGITDYLRPNDVKHLSTDYITIAKMFKQAGYHTGIIGKWHLTGYAAAGVKEYPPAMHGFDETIVSENRGIGAGSYFYPYHFNKELEQKLPGKEYLIDRCNIEAVEFIERNKDWPFFLYLSHYAVHTSLAGKQELVAKYEKKPGAGKGHQAKRNNPHLAAQLECVDTGVSEILKKLAELGLKEKTIIIFTSDNGGEDRVTSNLPLRAGKSTLYEGGIRIPLIIYWPQGIKTGSICEMPTNNIDFYPTFMDILGYRPQKSQKLDGISILPLLQNPDASLKRDALYWHYPLEKPHFLGGRSSGAVRKGDWKLIEFFDTSEVELYNIAADIGETNNLAEKLPEKKINLQKLLAKWRREAGAE